MLNLEAFGLQLQKTTLGVTRVNKKQETEATICNGSTNLENKLITWLMS